MAFDGQRQFIGRHALAIIGDGQKCPPAIAQIDIDARRPGIKGVFHQFLKGRRRPFDHLTGGNLVDQVLWQDAKRHEGGARDVRVIRIVDLG